MRKILRSFAVVSLLFVVVSFVSCSSEEDDWNNISSLRYLSITNAKNLYISTGNAGRYASRNASDTRRIFKITEDGYTEVVKYLDEDGNEVSIVQEPTAIYPVNDVYVFVCFDWKPYLVRKTDGAVFSLENVGKPREQYNTYKNAPNIKTDKDNKMYFIAENIGSNQENAGRIIKLELDGINILSAVPVSPSTDSIDFFDVDWNGNLIYDGCLTSDMSNRIRRLRKVNGGLLNLSRDSSAYWIDLDGYICYLGENREAEYDTETDSYTYYGLTIKKLIVDSVYNVTDEVYGYIGGIFWQMNSYELVLKDRIVIICDGIYEVYNETGNPRMVTLTPSIDMYTVTAATSTDNFYYIAGMDTNNNTFLIKVNPEDDSYTHLLTQNDYDVYSFTASETDGIVFNALRMSDGKKIIGKVGINGGAVTMIDEESDVEITYLERIN